MKTLAPPGVRLCHQTMLTRLVTVTRRFILFPFDILRQWYIDFPFPLSQIFTERRCALSDRVPVCSLFTRPTMELKGRVIVYSIVGCPHCMRAKNSLQDRGLPYTDVSLDSFPQCREDVKHRTGKNTVPQIFFNAVHVGGNDELQALMEDKARFDALVEDVKQNAPPADAPVPPDPATATDDAGLGDFVCEPDEYAALVKNLKVEFIILG